MGIVIPFKKAAPFGRPVKRGSNWHLFLGPEGQHPRGHPPVSRGPRGKVLLAINQVWVESYSDMLWVVRGFKRIRNRRYQSYQYDVELAPYYRGRQKKIIAESTFRGRMKVWEDAIQFRIDLCARVDYSAKNDPESPFRGRDNAVEAARKFFGVDRYGNRID